jgi:hypothetical protein
LKFEFWIKNQLLFFIFEFLQWNGCTLVFSLKSVFNPCSARCSLNKWTHLGHVASQEKLFIYVIKNKKCITFQTFYRNTLLAANIPLLLTVLTAGPTPATNGFQLHLTIRVLFFFKIIIYFVLSLRKIKLNL